MPLLCLRLLSDATEGEGGWTLAAEWLMVEDDGSPRQQGTTDYRGLADLLDPTQDWVHESRNVLLLVPHDQILEVTVNVPGKSAAQMRRALAFAVEEFASTDIERLHIASDRIRPGKPIRCQLLERELLTHWLACLGSLGIKPGYLLADTELLPLEESGVHVLIDGSHALVRSPLEAAMVDRGNLVSVLQTIDAKVVHVAGGQLEPLEIAQLTDARIVPIPFEGSSIEYLVRQWQRDEGINLLQGEFLPARTTRDRTSTWYAPAMVAAVWIGVAWLLMLGKGFWADWRSEALESKARALYTDIYPDEPVVRNVRRSFSQKLGQAGGESGYGFAHLTADLATALESSAQVRSLEFEADSGELKAEVIIASHAAVEEVNSRLSSLGVDAELLNAIQEDQHIRAYFKLKTAR